MGLIKDWSSGRKNIIMTSDLKDKRITKVTTVPVSVKKSEPKAQEKVAERG